MPGTRCKVAVCNNSLIKTKKAGKHIIYHSFPKDPQIRKIWVQKCHRDGEWNPATSCICSEHFREDDYERDLKAELLQIPRKQKKLKPTAVPSLKLSLESTNQEESPISVAREKRLKKRSNKRLVQELIEASTSQTSIENEQEALKEIHIEQNEQDIPKEIHVEPSFETKYYHLLTQYNELKEMLNTNIITMKNLKANVKFLEKEIINKSEEKNFNLKVREVFKGYLSNTQLDIILLKKRKVRWSGKDMNSAFALWYLNKSCYTYLRDELKYPLPGVSTLQRWACKIDARDRLLKEVYSIHDYCRTNYNSES